MAAAAIPREGGSSHARVRRDVRPVRPYRSGKRCVVLAIPPQSPADGDARRHTARTRTSATPTRSRDPAPVYPPDEGRRPGRADPSCTGDTGRRRCTIGPGMPGLPSPSTAMAAATAPPTGGQSMSLQTALYGALTSNPDLVVLDRAARRPTRPPRRLSRWPGISRPRSIRPSGSIIGRSRSSRPRRSAARARAAAGRTTTAPTTITASSTSIFRCGNRSSWGTRPPTAITWPRPHTNSSNGSSCRPS